MDVKERFEKEMLLSLDDRPQVLLWLKRSTRYLPIVVNHLRDRNMPEDLKFLAIVESALRPHAGSSKGAIGFWQLLPETARKYGLDVDEYVDERRDIVLSTQAALNYLQDLHQRFSSWALTLAAYNMGEEGLTAEILEQNCRDYYQLYLPLETQRFVLRMLAVKLIMNDPGRYGLQLKTEDYYPPLDSRVVAVDCFQETPIRLVAQATETTFKVVKDLNPKLRGHYLQTGRHQLNLPRKMPSGFPDRLRTLSAEYAEMLQHRVYIVQSGDSLSTIAEKFNVPLAAILIWNRIDMQKTIYPGQRLVIYPRPSEEISVE